MKDTRIDRRGFLRIAGIAGVVLVGAACAPAAAPTPTPTKAPAATPKPGVTPSPVALKPEEVRAQLYELAKKEGQVMAYWTGTTKEMDSVRQVFSKSYPGVEIREWMGTGEQIVEKLTTEYKAGKVNADCFQFPTEQWLIALREGLAEKWSPPERVNFPPEAVDPNGFYVTEAAVIHVISYNTQSVPAAEAPKNYQDLLKPIFKGKLGLEIESYSWFTQRIAIWGRDKAIDYAKKLAAQQPRFIKGHTTLADAVVSGEVWAAVNVFQHRVEEQIGKGAPVKWVVDEPTGAETNSIGMTKGAPHPNAAKLFLDWKLSEEGQKIVYEVQKRYPMRKGAALPPAMQVKVALPSLETVEQIQKNQPLFKEIFGLV